MNRQVLAIFLLALAWFEPSGLSGATKLTIGHSTINPRISPLWIAQEKGYFQKVRHRRDSGVCPQYAFDDCRDESRYDSDRLRRRQRHPGRIGDGIGFAGSGNVYRQDDQQCRRPAGHQKPEGAAQQDSRNPRYRRHQLARRTALARAFWSGSAPGQQ
jgi:hypothetical protein